MMMIDDAEVQNQFRQISDAVREKKITRPEAQARLYKLAGELELDQWQIIEDLRHMCHGKRVRFAADRHRTVPGGDTTDARWLA
jgi:hypothetical protein